MAKQAWRSLSSRICENMIDVIGVRLVGSDAKQASSRLISYWQASCSPSACILAAAP